MSTAATLPNPVKHLENPFRRFFRTFPPAALTFLTWLFVLTLVPFLLIMAMAFMKKTGYGVIEFSPTLENFLRCFQWLYFKVFIKTIFVAASATFISLMIGFPVAYFLARAKGGMKQWGLVLLFIPFWTNFILRIYAMISLLGNHGLLNQFLIKIGLINEPISLLYTRTGVFIGLIYNYLPFLVVPIFSALEKFDVTLREAANDLGATRFQTFVKVLLPNIQGGILVGCLFVFIPMMGEYVIPDLLGGAREAFLGNIMVDQFFKLQDWPFGSAIATLLSALLMVALFIESRSQRRPANG